MSSSPITKEVRPIFILYARSFWAGVLAPVLAVLDLVSMWALDPANGLPISTFLSWILNGGLDMVGLSVDVTAYGVQKTIQVAAFILAPYAVQQRSGGAQSQTIPRPYSLDPTDW